LKIKIHSFTLDCRDPHALADFYAKLLNWKSKSLGEDWACVYATGNSKEASPCILFQRNLDYVPPVWPETDGAQQQMAHLDFDVNDLEKAVEHAIKCGASMSEQQFSDRWRVMFDPAGHPFCLCKMDNDD